MEKEQEEKVMRFFTLLQLLTITAMDIMIIGALANTTLSNTNAWIAGVATATLSLAIVVDTIVGAKRKPRHPPSQTAP